MGQIKEIKERYVFRKLNASDIMPMCKIIGKIGIIELADCFEISGIQDMLSTYGKGDVNNNAVFTSVGVKIALKVAGKIIENLPSCENDIYQLLGDVSGLEIEDIRRMDIDEFLEMLIAFFKKEEFGNFIKVVSVFVK